MTGRLPRPQPSSSGRCPSQPPPRTQTSQSANVISCFDSAKRPEIATSRTGQLVAGTTRSLQAAHSKGARRNHRHYRPLAAEASGSAKSTRLGKAYRRLGATGHQHMEAVRLRPSAPPRRLPTRGEIERTGSRNAKRRRARLFVKSFRIDHVPIPAPDSELQYSNHHPIFCGETEGSQIVGPYR